MLQLNKKKIIYACMCIYGIDEKIYSLYQSTANSGTLTLPVVFTAADLLPVYLRPYLKHD
jgi:hypothetical protein